jgi:hypothetical protein
MKLFSLFSKSGPRSSEFWALIAALVGQVAVATGWLSQEDWEGWGKGAVSYALFRFVSKNVKKEDA